MKKVLPWFILLFFAHCSKEEMAKNAIIDAMTSGLWKMTTFNDNGTDKTADFQLYKFQFKINFSVDAIKGSAVEKTGTWEANATDKTITSNFSNAAVPIILLNGTWKITNNSWTFVEATKTIGSDVMTLRLDKL